VKRVGERAVTRERKLRSALVVGVGRDGPFHPEGEQVAGSAKARDQDQGTSRKKAHLGGMMVAPAPVTRRFSSAECQRLRGGNRQRSQVVSSDG
jgi:hypothetical protein